MPKWIHDRAEHLLAKNPSMSKSQAFAIATQQSHKLGKSPKGYGTAEGKKRAKMKYDKPKKSYVGSANPGKLESPKLAAPRDLLPGGKADKKEPEDFDPEQLRMGTEVEREHVGDNTSLAQEIAMDHLEEHPEYYSALKKMESRLGKQAMVAKLAFPQFGFVGEIQKLAGLSPAELEYLQSPRSSVGRSDLTRQDEYSAVLNKEAESLRNKGYRTMMRALKSLPPNEKFLVKKSFATSEYSGPIHSHMLPQRTYMPGPGEQQAMTTKQVPEFKTAGPPSEKGWNPKLESTEDVKMPISGRTVKEAWAKLAGPAITPRGRLVQSMAVGKPRASAPPGPSIAQISKPIGFGRPKPDAVKTAADEGVSPGVVGAGMAGAGLLGSPIAAGLMRHQVAKPDAVGSALLDSLKGMSDAPVISPEEVQGRLPNFLRRFLSPESAGAAEQAMTEHIRHQLRNNAGFIPQGGPKGEDVIAMGKDFSKPSILAHEMGHAQIQKTPLLKYIQSKPALLAGALGRSVAMGAGVGAATGISDSERTQRIGRWAPTLLSAPLLAVEAGASALGLLKMRRAGASGAQMLRGVKTLAPAWGTYAAPVALSTGVAHLSQAGVRAMREYEKKSGEKTAAMEKDALIERLIRLLATPIPGTPKLLMKKRTPQELANLQHAVDTALNSRVKDPIMRRLEPRIQKIPPGRIQKAVRTLAEGTAEDPVGNLLLLKGVPGALAVVNPALGAAAAFVPMQPAYIAAKRGLERVIDKTFPIPPPTMSTVQGAAQKVIEKAPASVRQLAP